jgi:hypothetical protein
MRLSEFADEEFGNDEGYRCFDLPSYHIIIDTVKQYVSLSRRGQHTAHGPHPARLGFILIFEEAYLT